jgi:hypothetical protein
MLGIAEVSHCGPSSLKCGEEVHGFFYFQRKIVKNDQCLSFDGALKSNITVFSGNSTKAGWLKFDPT